MNDVDDNPEPVAAHPTPRQNGMSAGRLLLGTGIIVLVAALYITFGDQLNLNSLADREDDFRRFLLEKPWLVYGLSFLIYVAVTGLSLPGAAPMTLLLGWLLGFWKAFLIVSFASTLGASIAFLLSRYLFREAILTRYGGRFDAINESLHRDGAYYLFSLRLIPAVPFFLINVLMGLTPMRLTTFWWVSQLGMLPGTAAYVYAGTSVPSLRVIAEHGATGIVSPQLIIAFVILGLLPITFRKLLNSSNSSSNASAPQKVNEPPHQ